MISGRKISWSEERSGCWQGLGLLLQPMFRDIPTNSCNPSKATPHATVFAQPGIIRYLVGTGTCAHSCSCHFTVVRVCGLSSLTWLVHLCFQTRIERVSPLKWSYPHMQLTQVVIPTVACLKVYVYASVQDWDSICRASHADCNKWQKCRCAVGLESPEVANAVLADGAYHPDPAIDMWQFGMFVVGLLGGDLPEAHTGLYTSAGWNKAIDCVNAHQGIDILGLPIMVKHLQHLQDLKVSGVHYPSQVTAMPLHMCIQAS